MGERNRNAFIVALLAVVAVSLLKGQPVIIYPGTPTSAREGHTRFQKIGWLCVIAALLLLLMGVFSDHHEYAPYPEFENSQKAA